MIITEIIPVVFIAIMAYILYWSNSSSEKLHNQLIRYNEELIKNNDIICKSHLDLQIAANELLLRVSLQNEDYRSAAFARTNLQILRTKK